MKKSILTLSIASTLLILLSSGCRKDIYGCTDPYAANYARNANVDNGTCRYYGNVMFWTNRDEGVVTVTINGQSATITGYVTGGVPNCGNTVSANFSLIEGSYTYSVSAPPSPSYPNGYTLSGTAVSSSTTCNAYQL